MRKRRKQTKEDWRKAGRNNVKPGKHFKLERKCDRKIEYKAQESIIGISDNIRYNKGKYIEYNGKSERKSTGKGREPTKRDRLKTHQNEKSVRIVEMQP